MAQTENAIMCFFSYEHLANSHARTISSTYKSIAAFLNENLTDSEEKTVALRKLLESKDAAVRAAILEATTND